MTGERRGRLLRARTVRAQLTVSATALVALVLVASAFALVATQSRVLTHGIDEALIQRADNIEPDVVRGIYGVRLPNEGDPEDSFLQVLDGQGTVVAKSDNATGLAAAVDPAAPEGGQVIETFEGVGPREGDFRVLARPLDTAPEQRTLVVAKNLDDVHESVNILIASLAVSIPVVTGLLALLVWWLTGRMLRPVEAIRREVESIGGDELHRRVPIPTSEDEIARLASTMNEMLGRVQEATERQRRFAADASHELRGPLTRLRASVEVALAHAETVDPKVMARELLADTVELQKLVEDLLFLARSESGSLTGPSRPVDLDDLVLEEAESLRRRGVVQVDVRAVSAARTKGDPDQLARVIRNLSGNAERHAARNVSFELRETNGWSELVVADDGPGIAPDFRDAVFERFTRLDEARSRDHGGSGLGLAIVHDIVTRHEGTVAIADNEPGARFVVRLPRED
ncbi:MAG TPA: HAMP domain-containing sensor histidine kinase [Nocardioidaceae bacterium]|nr:HAMP domain-containing sensor histidine kinase [Nocardioidaceae bacterium]